MPPRATWTAAFEAEALQDSNPKPGQAAVQLVEHSRLPATGAGGGGSLHQRPGARGALGTGDGRSASGF